MTVSATVEKSFPSKLHPCAIDSFPTSPETSYVVCGCYELDESSQHREGSMVVYKCTSSDSGITNVVEEDTIACSSGVLDLKTTSKHVFAALASETLAIHQIHSTDSSDSNQPVVSHTPELELKCEGEGLFLALDFARKSTEDNLRLTDYVQHLAVSTQSGSILVYTATESSFEELCHISDAHNMLGESMPVWTVGFNPHDHSDGGSNLLFSGGDDCAFRLWDIRCPERAYHCNKKTHTAGVTSVAYHYQHDHLMTSGSYDESSITWDLRALREPLLTIETGGGVWRTRWITPRDELGRSDSRFDYLCTANMQGGSHVFLVDINTQEPATQVELRDEHTVKYTDNKEKHLAYGIGMFQHRVEEHRVHFDVASCSFYDNAVDFWTASLPYEAKP